MRISSEVLIIEVCDNSHRHVDGNKLAIRNDGFDLGNTDAIQLVWCV